MLKITQKYNIFGVMGDAPGELEPRTIHFYKGSVELTLSPDWHVTLRLFRDIHGQIYSQHWDPKFSIGGGVAWSTKGEDRSGIYMYHAKFHDNWLHRRQDICWQNTKHIETI